jgi:CRISPR-associated endoribonuclease Cas6/Csy4 subtype I-F
MVPRHYVDMAVVRGHRPLAFALLMKALHGAFGAMPGRYAVAFPGYGSGAGLNKVRVFAGQRDDLDALVAALQDCVAFTDKLVEPRYPQTVPENHAGPWASFSRYRIPSRKADERREGALRIRRMHEADEVKMLYVAMSSRSNQQSFRLYVRKTGADGPLGPCEPDAYGLSVSSRPFAVPDLP